MADTFEEIEISAKLLLAATASARVQVTVWLAITQLHPVPVAAVGVRSLGNVSVTVTVPLLAAVPMFEIRNK